MNKRFDFNLLYELLEQTKLAPWMNRLPVAVAEALDNSNHGKLPEWRAILAGLPEVAPLWLICRVR